MSSENTDNIENTDENTQADHQIKLLLIGDSGIYIIKNIAVGKTCLMVRYTQDKFTPVFMSTVV